ncbi:hypothetical protein F5Y12DRAFT_730781 [Xylaria sp. FL1777]|nr:hypothetical protein F5Y12DRAFT_730781 [Xylaria sp. FL1777]
MKLLANYTPSIHLLFFSLLQWHLRLIVADRVEFAFFPSLAIDEVTLHDLHKVQISVKMKNKAKREVKNNIE